MSTGTPRSSVSDPGPPDADLLERARNGETVAYVHLLNRYRDRLAGYAYRLTGDAAEAEDVAQESFTRLWRSFSFNPPSGNAGAWLHRVARNLVIDRLRRRGRHAGAPGPDLPDDTPGAEEDAQRRDTQTRVRAAMAMLPERQRAAIALVHYQHLSNIDAAAQLDISVEALESLLARGRRNLRDALRAEREDLGPTEGSGS